MRVSEIQLGNQLRPNDNRAIVSENVLNGNARTCRRVFFPKRNRLLHLGKLAASKKTDFATLRVEFGFRKKCARENTVSRPRS